MLIGLVIGSVGLVGLVIVLGAASLKMITTVVAMVATVLAGAFW